MKLRLKFKIKNILDEENNSCVNTKILDFIAIFRTNKGRSTKVKYRELSYFPSTAKIISPSQIFIQDKNAKI